MSHFKVLTILILSLFLTGCSTVAVTPGNIDKNGNLEVIIQDQYTEIIDLRLSEKIDDIILLDNYSIDDKFINISSNTIPVLDDLICLKEGSALYQGEVLQVTPLGGTNYQIKLDKALDHPFTTAGGCSLRNDNWAVDGSITEHTFSLSPGGLYDNVSWDITRVILVCKGEGVGASNEKPDLSSFFTQEPIVNGVTFRTVDGITKNIFNIKDNFHIASETYDLNIYDANRFGDYAVVTRRTFNGADKNGVTIRLDAITGDTFELIIADDLTGMTQCHAVAQGHVIE